MSLSPSRKSSSMFSICVPALRRWELHQAVKVCGGRTELGGWGGGVSVGVRALEQKARTVALPLRPHGHHGARPPSALLLIFMTQAGGPEETAPQRSLQTTTW